MKTEKIAWKRSERSNTSSPPPASPSKSSMNGKALAGILVVLALMMIYHGSAGQKMVSRLESYLGGKKAQVSASNKVQPATSQAVASQTTSAKAQVKTSSSSLDSAIATMGTDLAKLPTLLQHGQWSTADTLLATIETDWNQVDAPMGKMGIPVADLNGLTADLANVSTDIAGRNVKSALVAVSNAQKSLAWISTQYVSHNSPTLQEMNSLVNNLNTAVHHKNWTQVADDAQALSQLMAQIKKGF